jgi:hypothetical protein
MLVVYYSVLIAWVINAFFDAFGDEAPWADEGVTGDVAITYFEEDIIGTSTLGESRKLRMMWGNVYSALAWLVIWAASRWYGSPAAPTSTMGIPIIVLAAF